MKKLEELYQYSNPEEVERRAMELQSQSNTSI